MQDRAFYYTARQNHGSGRWLATAINRMTHGQEYTTESALPLTAKPQKVEKINNGADVSIRAVGSAIREA